MRNQSSRDYFFVIACHMVGRDPMVDDIVDVDMDLEDKYGVTDFELFANLMEDVIAILDNDVTTEVIIEQWRQLGLRE